MVKGFDDLYRCQAEMTDLKPNTRYIYKIGNTSFTNVRSFKTSGTTSTLFGFIADPQLYGSGSPQTTYQTHLSDMLHFASSEYGRIPDLLLGGGDMVERGGDFPLWTYLLDNNENLYNMPIACSTGNHEYGDGIGGATLGDKCYSAMYNNPKNGFSGKENVAYWFKWNNAIIFVWDNIPKSEANYQKHYDWMKGVLEKNQYQFIICMFHFPIYGGSSDSTLMTNFTRPLLEDLGVDICLSGHDHSYKLTENYYQGKKSTVPGRGTYYLEVSDTYTTDSVPVYALLNITDSSIIVKQYASNRNYYGQFMISAKRSSNYASQSLDKDEFMKKLTIEANDNDYSQAILTVDKSGYGMVNSVKVYDGDKLLLNQWADSDMYNTYTISKLNKNANYNARVVVDFKDGEVKEINIPFSTSINYGHLKDITTSLSGDKFTIRFTNDLRPATQSVNIYVNGEFASEMAVSSKYVRIDASLIKDGLNVIEFKAVDDNGEEHLIETINYGEEEITYNLVITTKELEITEGENSKVIASVDNDGKLEYTSSDENIARVDANGKITAIQSGVATITVKVSGTDVTGEVKVTVKAKTVEPDPVEPDDPTPVEPDDPLPEEPDDPTPVEPDNPTPIEPDDPTPIEPAPSSGCNKGTIVSLWSLILPLGVVVLFRRRRLY